MILTFADASSLNGDVSQCNTGNVVDMERMFVGALLFNRDHASM